MGQSDVVVQPETPDEALLDPPETDPEALEELEEFDEPRAPDEPLLVFVHIRKTAGKSLRKILQDAHPGKGRTALVYNYFTRGDDSRQAMQEVAEDPPARLNVVHGHVLNWPDIPWPEHTKFCTILRDPVERSLSHYYWLRQRDPGFTMSLDDAITSGAVPANLQTWVLAAADESKGELTRAALKTAVAALDRFDVVGLTERFDESVALMTRAFGWPWLLYARQNATQARKPRSEIPAKTIKLIERYNALDIELHKHATERLEADLAKAGPRLGAEVAAVQRANERLGARDDQEMEPLHPDAITGGEDADVHEAFVEAMTELLLREHDRVEGLEARERVVVLEEQLHNATGRAQQMEAVNKHQRDRIQELTEARNESRSRVAQAAERLKTARDAGAKRATALDQANKELAEARAQLAKATAALSEQAKTVKTVKTVKKKKPKPASVKLPKRKRPAKSR